MQACDYLPIIIVALVACLRCTAGQAPERTNFENCVDQFHWCNISRDYCYTTTMATMCRRTCNNCACDPVQYGCQHDCRVSESGATCLCRVGYTLHSNGRNCTDINECALNTCPTERPYCLNTKGSFACSRTFGCDNVGNSARLTRYQQERCCVATNATCGQNPGTSVGVSLAGPDVIITQWPWAVYLRIGKRVCVGVLISSDWIIASAHCFSGWKSRQALTATFGMRVTTPGVGNFTRSDIHLEEVIRHTSYTFPHYDIALGHLERPIERSHYAAPICLPSGEFPPQGSKCFLVGYETELVGGTLVRQRKDISMTISQREECQQNLQTYHNMDSNMICAKFTTQQIGSCPAESGGPLVCQRCASCDWYVAGIMSYGDICVGGDSYAVFTSIESYENWIGATTSMSIRNDQSCGARMPSWRPWSSWSSCDVSCGGGTRSRSRVCFNGNPGNNGCFGAAREIFRCNQRTCPRWRYVSGWKPCSQSCGGGIQIRLAVCINGRPGQNGCNLPTPRTTRRCNTHFCATWTNWTSWSRCSSSCGTTGVENSTRVCHGRDVDCTGETRRTRECNRVVCPIWSSWSPWPDCPVTCGGAAVESTRTCEVGSCPGYRIRIRSCAQERCPGMDSLPKKILI